MSDQNLRQLLSGTDVKSGILERIATALGENVAYFYNEQPIFTLVDYVDYEATKRENVLLRQIVSDKEELIAEIQRK